MARYSTEEIFDLPVVGENAPYEHKVNAQIEWATGIYRRRLNIEFENAEYYQSFDRPTYLFVANHQSFLDPTFIIAALYPRKIRQLSKEENLQVPILKHWIAMHGAIPIKRNCSDRAGINRAVETLKSGVDVGIFPEGTRMNGRPGKVREFHAGATLIASMAKVDIVPAAIINAELIMPYKKFGIHFPDVKVRFGEPLFLDDFSFIPRQQRRQAIVDEAMRQVDALRAGESLEQVRKGYQEKLHQLKGQYESKSL